MKTIVIIILSVMLGFSSHAQEPDQAVVDRYLTAAFATEWEEMAGIMHDSIVDYHPTVLMPPARGKQELLNGWKQSVLPFEKLDHHLLGGGVISITSGELEGEWVLDAREVTAGIPGTDQMIKWQMVGLYKLAGGQIMEVRNYGNTLDIYVQMGFELSPPKQE